MKENPGKPWTIQEIEDLRIMVEIEKLTYKEVAEALGRTYGAVRVRANHQKLKATCFWSEAEERKLRELIENSTIDKYTICQILRKSKTALNYKVVLIYKTSDLKKIRNHGRFKNNRKKWTSEDDKFIYQNYYKLGKTATAKVLGRTVDSLLKRITNKIDKSMIEKGFYTKGWHGREMARIRKENRDL